MAVQQKKRRRVFRAVDAKCSFCENSTNPDYKEAEVLKSFVTDRGKLLGRARTGLCQKHQRRLSIAVKRARHLAKIPFVTVFS